MLLVQQVPHDVTTFWAIGMVNDAHIILASVGLCGMLFNLYQTIAVYRHITKFFKSRLFINKVSIPRLMLLINLSVSDMILCTSTVLTVLLTALRSHSSQWDILLRRVLPIFQFTSALVSSANITAIAIDRYITIVGNGGRRYSPQTVSSKKCFGLTLILFIWLGGFIFTLPLALYQRFQQNITISDWPNMYLKSTYTLSFVIVQYMIPLLILLVVHSRICSFLSTHQVGHIMLPHQMARKRRTNYMLAAATIIFMATWFPLTCLTVITEFVDIWNNVEQLSAAFASCQTIALLSTWYNTLLYGWFNTKIRRELVALKPNCSFGPSPRHRVLTVIPQLCTPTAVSALLPHRSRVLGAVIYTSGRYALVETRILPPNTLVAAGTTL